MDRNIEDLIDLIKARSAQGVRTYGVTTDRANLNEAQWEQHLLEELVDAAVYLIARRRARSIQAS